MPPIAGHFLRQRDDTGRNFSIIFAVIAFVIIAGCLTWAIILSKIRNKSPQRSSSARPGSLNGLNQSNGATANPSHPFPSHPAILRGFRKQSSQQLRQYDPRTETPFPNTPGSAAAIDLPALTPRIQAGPVVGASITSYGLFSPARDRVPTRRGMDDHNLGDFVCNNEQEVAAAYHLPAPQPLLLRARSAGRAPPLARHLSKFPMPRSRTAQSDKIVHPNKLFQELEQRYSKTTMTSTETPCPLPPAALHVKDSRGSLNFGLPDRCSSTFVAEDMPKQDQAAKFCEQICEVYLATRNTAGSSPINVKPDAAQQTHSVAKARTVTRPKTPVAEIPGLYDSNAKVQTIQRKAISRQGTVSTSEPLTASPFSGFVQSSTPPTSTIAQAGNIALKRCKANTAHEKTAAVTLETSTPASSSVGQTPSSTALPMAGRSEKTKTSHEGQKHSSNGRHLFRSSKAFGKHRPPRLDLTADAKSPAKRKRQRRPSVASVGSMLMPLVRSKRPSVQASSIYSRDTRGVSFLRSPLSPALSGHASVAASTLGSQVLSLHRKASSVDLLRQKIDTWDLNTAGLKFPTSPSAELKRALSDLGPRSPPRKKGKTEKRVAAGDGSTSSAASGRGITVPKICVGRASDDIFHDPPGEVESGRVLKRVLDMEAAASMAKLNVTPPLARAPGGAQWI